MAYTVPCKIVEFPAAVVIDTREQRPYEFENIRADAKADLAVKCEVKTLKSGDYSLEGYEDRIAIERKSLVDLYGTLGRGRARFERELRRLDYLDFACVMVEAEISEVCGRPPSRSKLCPRAVYGSILAFMQRYTRVHWFFAPDRRAAEVTTFRMLERFYKDHTK